MINPSLNSPILKLIFEIESMRNRPVEGSTPPWIFQSMKELMYLAESVASAKIEGNGTTLVDAALDSINETNTDRDDVKQHMNIRAGLNFIDKNLNPGDEITMSMIRELHKIVVDGLSIKSDGSLNPGEFKERQNKISNSFIETTSPEYVYIEMQKLLDEVNKKTDPQYDIINISLAHHRFTTIHPFDNGNGRMARLFTYAMLVQKGFVSSALVLNPSSIFCNDRQKYYDMLNVADRGQKNNDDALREEWCLYVAEGIKNEIERTKKLLDKDTVVQYVIRPALTRLIELNKLTTEEKAILEVAINKDIIQAGNIAHIIENPRTRTRKLKDLSDRGILYKHEKKYVFSITKNNELIPIIIERMQDLGMLAV